MHEEPSPTPNASGDAAAAAAGRGQQALRSSARRRLWQLPTQAHELLLALSFPSDALRRELARTLGRLHKGRCVLKGRDVDVLYSAVHDMVTRNPLSESLHKRLDERHAAAIRRLASQRDRPQIEAAWADALANDKVPSLLWAVLTHPLGSELEVAVLYDARHWIFTHARRSLELRQAALQTQTQLADARQTASALQARLLAQQRQAVADSERSDTAIARLQGELARRAAAPAARPAPNDMPRRNTAERTEVRRAPLVRPSPRTMGHPASLAAETNDSAAVPCRGPATPAKPEPIVVRDRRVLCVGGIQHAVARYRHRIEKLGGRFEHHDGGVEDSVQALDARLGRADLIICQAACINHEAYHRVKRHCERTGTPCVYLDRPSLSRFDRALGWEADAADRQPDTGLARSSPASASASPEAHSTPLQGPHGDLHGRD